MSASWKVETAYRLGRQSISLNALPFIVRAANALQRANEADCSICPEAWQKSLRKRADGATQRLRTWLEANGTVATVETQGDPRGAALSLTLDDTKATIIVPGDGFSAAWFERAERAAYAERGAVK